MPLFRKTFLAAALTAAVATHPAAAAAVNLRFQETAGASSNTQYYGPNVYYGWQNDFHTASADYDFHFTYDTEAGPGYDLTLVSGARTSP